MACFAKLVSGRGTSGLGLVVAVFLALTPAVGFAAPGESFERSPNATGGGVPLPVEVTGGLTRAVPRPTLPLKPGAPGDLCLLAPRRLREIGSEGQTGFSPTLLDVINKSYGP